MAADALAPLLADGIVEAVLGRLKSGKEADIYLVRHGGEVVAAKVYKEREGRSFRNNAGYKEGRLVRDSRTQRAMDRGSRFGRAAAEEAWKAKEAEALHRLHAAGVRVPRPVLYYEGVLLMEAVVDAEGRPAPRLVDAHVPRERAAACYAELRQQAVRMLACDLIHGDLSPYNVLVAHDGLVVIDLPQVVGAAHNSQARSFFQRDLATVRRHLAAIDPGLHGRAGDADEIWRAYERRELGPDFVPSGRAPPPAHPRPPQGPRGQPHHPARPGPREAEPRRPAGNRGGPHVEHVTRLPHAPRSPPRPAPAHAQPQPSRAAPPQPSRLAPARPQPHGSAPGHPAEGARRRRRRRRR